jgi:hypothetical protein
MVSDKESTAAFGPHIGAPFVRELPARLRTVRIEVKISERRSPASCTYRERAG